MTNFILTSVVKSSMSCSLATLYTARHDKTKGCKLNSELTLICSVLSPFQTHPRKRVPKDHKEFLLESPVHTNSKKTSQTHKPSLIHKLTNTYTNITQILLPLIPLTNTQTHAAINTHKHTQAPTKTHSLTSTDTHKHTYPHTQTYMLPQTHAPLQKKLPYDHDLHFWRSSATMELDPVCVNKQSSESVETVYMMLSQPSSCPGITLLFLKCLFIQPSQG